MQKAMNQKPATELRRSSSSCTSLQVHSYHNQQHFEARKGNLEDANYAL
jgi:hypothetical protein